MIGQTAGFALGHQAAKGTAAATYVRGRMSSSGAQPQYDRSDNTNQQTRIHRRPTTRHGKSIRTGYMEAITGSWLLYPNLLGYALIGAGFLPSTVDSLDGSFIHTFALADYGLTGYLSLLRGLDEGAAAFEHIIRDVRFSQVQVQSQADGITASVTGRGIDRIDAVGSETVTLDPDYPLSPATGSFTLTSTQLTPATFGTPRTTTITIDNPLDEDDRQQHSFLRQRFTPTGLDVTGVLQGLALSEDLIGELAFEGAGGQTPTALIPEADLNWRWESAAEIPAVAGKNYYVEFDLPLVQMFLAMTDVSGGGLILADCNFEMLDSAATDPLTVAIQTDYASFAGT